MKKWSFVIALPQYLNPLSQCVIFVEDAEIVSRWQNYSE